jgi:hypothetical protein
MMKDARAMADVVEYQMHNTQVDCLASLIRLGIDDVMIRRNISHLSHMQDKDWAEVAEFILANQ